MFNLIIGFLNDFFLIAGGIIVTAMGVAGQMVMPSKAVLLFATLTGLMQATRRVQSKIAPSPAKPEVPVRTPEQLAAQGKAREDAIVAVVERVLKAKLPPPDAPVTPSRPAPAPSATPVFVPEPPPPIVAAPPVVHESTRVPRERDLSGGEGSAFVSKP